MERLVAEVAALLELRYRLLLCGREELSKLPYTRL